MEDRLKKFARLVDAGSYTKAAQELHTSQPALSNAIQKLERELKAKLLIRGVHAFRLTEAGQIAYAHGHKLLLMEQNLSNSMLTITGHKQSFSLGCIDSIADVIVKANLLEILERDSSVSLHVQSSSVLLEQLKKGNLDLAIIARQVNLSSNILSQDIGRERFALVCSYANKDLFASQLRKSILTNFLAYNMGSTTQMLVQAQLEAQHLTQEAHFYSTNPSVLLELALQGKGVTALPRRYVESRLGTTLSELPLTKPITRPVDVIWHENRTLPFSAKEFIFRLSQEFI